MRPTLPLLTLTLCLALAVPAAAATIWDEAVDGDLSTDPDAPTAVAFGVGSNVISGSITSLSDTRDFISFSVAPGQQLASLLLLQFVDLPSGGTANRGYHAINTGATSFIPTFLNSDSFFGGNHLDPAPAGTDLLPNLASAPLAGTGFAVPLGPGTYSYLIQQTGPQTNGYSLDFVVTPEPSTLVLLALGLAGLAVRPRRA